MLKDNLWKYSVYITAIIMGIPKAIYYISESLDTSRFVEFGARCYTDADFMAVTQNIELTLYFRIFGLILLFRMILGIVQKHIIK